MSKRNLSDIIKTLNLQGKNVIVEDDELCKKMQIKLLEVFDDIVEVCENNNIRWQMSGGSALGTIRHKGFIPWDDDIDINMERGEVDKFLPIFKEKYGDKYWIYVPGDGEYDYLMIHIMTKDVKARVLMENKSLPSGLCIDIFVLENTPNNKIFRLIHGIGCMVLRYVLSCIRFKENCHDLNVIAPRNPELEKIIKHRTMLANIFGVINKKVWIKLAAKWFPICKNSNSEYVSIPSGSKQYFGELYLRDDMCTIEKGIFEGREVLITKWIDGYMKALYGNDYMKIPEEKDRGQHVLMELDNDALNKSIEQITKKQLIN